MAGITIERVSKVYGDGTLAVDDLNLAVEEGEFVVLVGPSGCGKTTALRMVAGLEEITDGSVHVGDTLVNDLPPKDRDIAMVFQNYALYPHMTAFDNIGFGLKMRGVPKREIERQVVRAAKVLGLEEVLRKKPRTLSGGQRQRVAMGRAIVREPKAFLMDEPLSNLDAKLRVSMRAELARLHEHLGVTTVYVTHDQVEAMTLGQRVAVMRDGVIQQVDAPQALFNRPRNLFVAAFIGSPAMNLVEARIDGGRLRFAGSEIPLPGGSPLAGRDGPVILGIRPSDFEHGTTADRELPRIRAQAEVVEELGSETHVIFPIDAPPVVTEATRAAADTHTDDEGTLLAGEERARFTARVDGKRQVTQGSEIELAVDYTCVHCFDPKTGDALQTRREREPVG